MCSFNCDNYTTMTCIWPMRRFITALWLVTHSCYQQCRRSVLNLTYIRSQTCILTVQHQVDPNTEPRRATKTSPYITITSTKGTKGTPIMELGWHPRYWPTIPKDRVRYRVGLGLVDLRNSGPQSAAKACFRKLPTTCSINIRRPL